MQHGLTKEQLMNNQNEVVTIRAYKYENKLHYEWEAQLLELTEQYAIVACHAKRIFTHHTKQKQFVMPYPSIEIFYFDRWYTFSVSFREQGQLMYYCNIAMPAKYEDCVISFVDVDLDYIKEPDEDWKVVDEDEFIHNQQQLNYPAELIAVAYKGLEELKQAVAEGEFPFDGSISLQTYENALLR